MLQSFPTFSDFNRSEWMKLEELVKEDGQFLLKSFGLTSPLVMLKSEEKEPIGFFKTRST
ncbi:hypothetical protein LEP1GSC056_3122 [Leptospira borgpetersenii str. Brem 328]|uniref:Uncharacterized protein n=1 Tax=Leptospira borgpetersenii str. Brem 328 TaxID=1049780 RepID=A0ABC9SDH7_LEPBO|nr:hypothetical protein LEP1GSC056_3122 [Leptospira borgpetersenii str. Brem 328]